MDAVSAAFAAVPRAGFLRPGDRARAAYDGPLPIGHGQTGSQPSTVAAMLRLLAVAEGDRVLDVGAGSGWTTALLARLTGPTGTVTGLELEPDLAAWGAANLAALVPVPTWATLRSAEPDRLGDPDGAPYDRILVSAAARVLPAALVDQLGEDGRIVVPVAGTMILGVRRGAGLVTSGHGSYRFVPLR